MRYKIIFVLTFIVLGVFSFNPARSQGFEKFLRNFFMKSYVFE